MLRQEAETAEEAAEGQRKKEKKVLLTAQEKNQKIHRSSSVFRVARFTLHNP